MKFEKAKAGQIVEFGPNKTRGEIVELMPSEQAAKIKVPDTMGSYIVTVPVKDLKRIKGNLEARARRKFSEKLTKKLEETSAASRIGSEEKKIKTNRK